MLYEAMSLLQFEVLPWCSTIQAGWRRHTRAPLLGSPQDDGVMHMRIVAMPVLPLPVEPPPGGCLHKRIARVTSPSLWRCRHSSRFHTNMTSAVAYTVSSSHAFVAAGRPYHHHHHWGRPLIETHLRQIERRLTTPDLDSGSISGASDVADALLLLCNKAGSS